MPVISKYKSRDEDSNSSQLGDQTNWKGQKGLERTNNKTPQTIHEQIADILTWRMCREEILPHKKVEGHNSQEKKK